MAIKIGSKSYATRKPGNLDAVLLETTGCDTVETARQLAGFPSAGRLASALWPFLGDDAASTPELAQMIADANAPGIITAVRKLYADPAPPADKDGDGK